MAVFISYSRQDADFVDNLATHLIKATKAHVWIDRWELHVGDSLNQRIHEALENASALVFVLSNASLASEWCQKELSTVLLRELEERRVIVLPVLLEDCEIPTFLQDKVCADFRTSFDSGLRDVSEALAKVTSEGLGRVEAPEWHVDWSSNWGVRNGRAVMNLTLVEQAKDQPYSVLTSVQIVLNQAASKRPKQLARAGVEPVARQLILELIESVPSLGDFYVILEDEEPVTKKVVVRDPKNAWEFEMLAECRRLGQDTGRDVLLNVGNQILTIIQEAKKRLRPLTPEERARALKIFRT